MSLLVVGLNHTTASIEVRERVAFAPEQLPEALQQVCNLNGIAEAMILSTCNRTELVAAVDDGTEVEESAIDWFASVHHVSRQQLQQSLYRYRDLRAMRHLMQVASGLDSMVMGEPQIFGQLKSAYATARHSGAVGTDLGRALEQVFAVAKRVRSETGIGQNPVSVAFAAVKLARHIFSDLQQSSALLIGAGETIELVARHLSEAGVRQMVIANRTLHRGEHLAAQFGAKAIMLSEIPEYLAVSDIVISSTASQLPIIGKGTVEGAVKRRRHKPIFMVDLAVPRDIETQVAELADVYLYSIDDLEQIVADNRKAREDASEVAEELIEAGLLSWEQARRGLDAVGALREVRASVESMRDREVEKALNQLRAGADPEQLLAQVARNLTNKFLHQPSVQLRKAASDGRSELLDWGRRLLVGGGGGSDE